MSNIKLVIKLFFSVVSLACCLLLMSCQLSPDVQQDAPVEAQPVAQSPTIGRTPASTNVSANEDENVSRQEEMGTRVRHKKSKRGVASVNEN